MLACTHTHFQLAFFFGQQPSLTPSQTGTDRFTGTDSNPNFQDSFREHLYFAEKPRAWTPLTPGNVPESPFNEHAGSFCRAPCVCCVGRPLTLTRAVSQKESRDPWTRFPFISDGWQLEPARLIRVLFSCHAVTSPPANR